MTKAVWVVQVLLALAFAAAGGMKLTTPKADLEAQGMGWAAEFTQTQVQLIGAAEVAGAVGLVVPAAAGLLPILTPVAAAALTLLMGGAVMTHVQRGEPPFAPLVLGALAAAVAWRRFATRT